MEYRQLGHTDLKVSTLALGTMTWGEQNTQAEAFEQMSFALDHGINFFDTAELYPIPPRRETYTRTESIIGAWLQHTGQRAKVILASKVAGPGHQHIRAGEGFTRKPILEALDASLKRLRTDYIDLYQLHWPERNTNFFGKLIYQATDHENFTPFEEILETFAECIKAGKIRAIGVSNETPWGLMKFLEQKASLPRVVSIQNPYNLLNRVFEVGLAEISHRESVGLLAYSPLAFGTLTGKYLNQSPTNARLTLFPQYQRYSKPFAKEAVAQYVDLARASGIPPAHLALSFVTSRPFTTSTIMGATTLEQLKENISSVDVKLNPEILNKIESIHLKHPFPCP